VSPFTVNNKNIVDTIDTQKWLTIQDWQCFPAPQQLLLQELLLQLRSAAISVSYSHSPSSNPSTPEKNEATRCLLPGPWQLMKIIKEGMK